MPLKLQLSRLFSKRAAGVPIHRVIRHVAECIGEAEEGALEDRFASSRDAIRQAAMSGTLTLRGSRQVLERWSSALFSDDTKKVPREYWKTHELTVIAANEGTIARTSAQTALKPALRREAGNSYSKLEADWHEVEALWPAPGAKPENGANGA